MTHDTGIWHKQNWICEDSILKFVIHSTKYVIQTSGHIFWIIYDDIFLKVIFLLCSNSIASCSLGSSVFVHSSQWLTSKYYIILWISTNGNQLNIKLQMNNLQKNNWADLLKCWCVIDSSYKTLPVQVCMVSVNDADSYANAIALLYSIY